MNVFYIWFIFPMLTMLFLALIAETENENGSEYEDFESPSDEDTVIQG